MKTSAKQELAYHILDRISDGVITNENKDEWHFHCFNEDHYLIGYYACSQWLEEHGIGEFEAAGICTDYEEENFGESHNTYDNSEKAVNMLAYIYGEELLSEIDAETIEELQEELQAITD